MTQGDYPSSSNDSTEAKLAASQHVEASPVRHDHENPLKTVDTSTSDAANHNYLKVVHTDGTVNFVDNRAIGGDAAGMPKGYFRSPQFIGTVVVRSRPL